MFKRRCGLIFLCLLFLLSCSVKQFQGPTITLLTEKPVTFAIEQAVTIEEHRRGLSNRTILAPDHGMLFTFDPPRETYFWMKDVLIPLDIIFIDATMHIMDIQENAPVCTTFCPFYESEQPVKYVLEINAGLSQKYGIHAGQEVIINDAT